MQDTTMHTALSKGTAVLMLALMLAVPGMAGAQKTFDTPEEAADALVESLTRHDEAQLGVVLGPDSHRLIPLDDVSAEDRTDFLAAWAAGHRIVQSSDTVARLELQDGWTLPVPIVRTGAGWAFDPRAGMDEMRTRRIGRNELATIQSIYAYVDAQREYAEQDRNGHGVLEYAQKFLSAPGKRDGLYWPDGNGEEPSPLGPLFDTAGIQDGYHGYRFKILKAQGPAANGGARPYVNHGRMTNGFALVAWPARYGETGVMSFLVNHDGVVYQKDLGHRSATLASAMTRFDPDASWQALPAP